MGCNESSIELTGWIVLVVSVILLGVAITLTTISHLNRVLRYNTSKLALVERHAARPGACFHLSDINQEFIILFDVVGDCQG